MTSRTRKQNERQEKPKKVLLEWVGGKDDGLRQIIDFSWLTNFDYNKWLETDPEVRETEIAEWRVGKKDSWRSYDCRVLECSDDNAFLASKLKEIGEKRNVQGSDNEDLDKEESSSSDSENESDSKENEEETVGAAKKRKIMRETGDIAMKILQEENKRLKMALAETVINKAAQPTVVEGPGPGDDGPKVPLYPGCKFTVNEAALCAAKTSGSRATFVGDMLYQLFPKHILVVSNLTGGKSKGQGDGLHRWALCSKRRKALIAAAILYFPGSTKTMVHRAIMDRINAFRFKLKSQNKLAEYEAEGIDAMKDKPHASIEDD